MGRCSVSTRSQSKPTDAISSATSGSPKFRRLPKHALPAASRCFTWLGVMGGRYRGGTLPPVEPCPRPADNDPPKGDAPVRAGISLTSRHAVKDPRQGARWMIERARAAWEAGLDSLFLGDHHATAVPYYQNVPMLGRLLAEWGDRPAGCLFLLPLWNPVLVAEQVGTLARLARALVRRGAPPGRVLPRALRRLSPHAVGGRDPSRRLRRRVSGRGQGGPRSRARPRIPRVRWGGARCGLGGRGRRASPSARGDGLHRRHRPPSHRRAGRGPPIARASSTRAGGGSLEPRRGASPPFRNLPLGSVARAKPALETRCLRGAATGRIMSPGGRAY